jgi:molybdopterin-containing oxidoreductase family membrane subunit
MNEKNIKSLMILAVLGLIAGTWGMVDRLFYGHISMGYGSYVPWGLWVVFYLFFVGLTAGAFLITIMTYIFGVKRFESVGPLAAFTVLVALICELTFISLDLGHLSRLYRFILTPNFSSLMTWFVIFTTAMLVIYILESFFLLRKDLVAWSSDKKRSGSGFYHLLVSGKAEYTEDDLKKDRFRVKVLSIVSLPVGLLFYGTNGAFFATVMNRPIWNSAITPVLFILAALLSGGALITFLIYCFQRDDEIVGALGRVTSFILAVYILFEIIQFTVGYLTGTPGMATSLNIMAFGPQWWSFWLIHLLIGSFIPLYIMFSRPSSSTALAWACLLIVISFAAVRFNFLIPDLAAFKLEGFESAFSNRHLSTNYVPSLNEWLVSIWIISMGILVFLAGTRWLPVLSSRKGGAEHA